MRISGWEERLLRVAEETGKKPHTWGDNDCVRRILLIAEEMTGTKPGPALPGYKTAVGAAAVMKRKGWSTVSDVLASYFEKMPVALARRGDAGIVEIDGTQSAVICLGHVWSGLTENGEIFVSRNVVKEAFRVG